MENQLSKRKYFRQAPQIINGKYSLKKSESDLIYMLLSEINKDDEDFKDYVFSKAQLEEKIGIKIDAIQLRNTAKSLMSKVLEIKESENKWELFSWFSYFKYDNGVITCSFDKRLKPYLLELKQFVFADLEIIMKIKSEYSRRIYLLLKERSKFGERNFDVKELMEILEVPKSFKVYSEFKKKILFQTKKDLNKYSDLEIDFTERKLGRKVHSVTFIIKKNQLDLKAFIDHIRTNYTNEELYKDKEGNMLKCSEKGLLYYADDVFNTIDKTKSLKLWEYLHENREKLLCYKSNKDDLLEIAKNLLTIGVPIEEISKAIKLSVEDIERLDF